MTTTTINDAEIAKFTAMAEEWWNAKGKFRPLHQINPARLNYIREFLISHFDRDALTIRPFEGLTILDIGCGGGLLCEPLARLGATVTGIDAAESNITIARLHAEKSGLVIDYRATTSELLAETGTQYDMVLNMEVVEHVDNIPLYIKSCADLVKPGGLTLTATINRTLRARLFAIFAAERILRWLPAGTHNWNRFLTPDEIKILLARNGLQFADETGIVFHPLSNEWRRSPDMGINYMVMAQKPLT